MLPMVRSLAAPFICFPSQFLFSVRGGGGNFSSVPPDTIIAGKKRRETLGLDSLFEKLRLFQVSEISKRSSGIPFSKGYTSVLEDVGARLNLSWVEARTVALQSRLPLGYNIYIYVEDIIKHKGSNSMNNKRVSAQFCCLQCSS